ncbi:MAG: sugar phosphate nucleotidyltransferase, partial [Candidatus Margulisiibacteriota bacterium]
MKLNTIILAAGMGKRLQSETCKVVVPLMGKPLILHLLDNIASVISPEDIYVVVGHCAQDVQRIVSESYGHAQYVFQKEQLGTGHAVMQCETHIRNNRLPALILAGDVPLVNADMVSAMYDFHHKNKSDITVLTTSLEDPTGYGRIVRDTSQTFLQKIVEQKDATQEESRIHEINSGIYLVSTELLFELLKRVTPNNQQKEYYLTDIVTLGKQRDLKVIPFLFENAELLRGINSREDLAIVANYLYQSTIKRHWYNGVTILSPTTTFIDPDVVLEADVIIEPCVVLRG